MKFSKFNRKFNRQYLFIGLGAILFLLSALVIPKQLKVSQVECFTQFGPCPDKYQNLASELMGRPILYPLPKLTLENTLKKFTEINSFELKRRLPSTVVVLLSLKKTLGNVGSTVLGSSIAVDDQGRTLPMPPDPALPVLYIDNWQPNVGLKQNEVLALKVLNSISKFSSSQVSGKVDNLLLSAKYLNGPEILIDVSQDEKLWLSPLQSLLERSKISSKPIKRIDVRFNSPLIMYQ